MRVTRAAIVLAGGDPVEPRPPTRCCPTTRVVVAADSGLHQARAARAARRLRRRRSRLRRSRRGRAGARRGRGRRAPSGREGRDRPRARVRRRPRPRRAADHGRRRCGRPPRPLPRQRRVARVAALRRSRGRRPLGDAYVAVVQGGRPPHAITGAAGLARHAARRPAATRRGITTTGLQYPLHGATLRPGTSRGVSNVLVGERGIGRARTRNAARRSKPPEVRA